MPQFDAVDAAYWTTSRSEAAKAYHRTAAAAASRLSLYTILSLPILYGVWHNQGGSGGGMSYIAQKSHNSIAIVWVMQMGGGNKGMIDSCIHKNK